MTPMIVHVLSITFGTTSYVNETHQTVLPHPLRLKINAYYSTMILNANSSLNYVAIIGTSQLLTSRSRISSVFINERSHINILVCLNLHKTQKTTRTLYGNSTIIAHCCPGNITLYSQEQGLTNYASIILGIIGGFSSTSIIGNNGRPNWHNFGCSLHYFYCKRTQQSS